VLPQGRRELGGRPLIVVTTADERERAGCLVGFRVQSSIEPQRYRVLLSKASYTYPVALGPATWSFTS
jgi:flavin reductase (DIM6/NTAB) family NADH-FMN oxidoreductase RutF